MFNVNAFNMFCKVKKIMSKNGFYGKKIVFLQCYNIKK